MTKQGTQNYEQKNRLLAKKGLTVCCVWYIMQAERLKERNTGRKHRKET